MAILGDSVSKIEIDIFSAEVDAGLSSTVKYLSSKYFYDDRGSRIFQKIMNMPEYYLTRAELEIFKFQTSQIVDSIDFSGHFNIIELGAGDGLKTKELLSFLQRTGADCTFIPVDISSEAIDQLKLALLRELPELTISPLVGDYFDVMQKINRESDKNLILLLGSNLGNYTRKDTCNLLHMVFKEMHSGDYFLLGVDLKKDPNLISKAYNDAQGITREFNLNLLIRINRELGGKFNLENFEFYSHYDPVSGEVRSYLISLSEQTVSIEYLEKSYNFKKFEPVYMELSKKYSLDEILHLAEKTDFSVIKTFTDDKQYFADILFQKPIES